ncbi:MAG: hypothetical protein AB7P04_04100 [Bacteriovoracia bacterium]
MPILVLLMGRFFRRDGGPLGGTATPLKPIVWDAKLNPRISLFGNIATLLVLLVLVLAPCVAAFRESLNSSSAETGLRGLAAIVSIGAFLGLGLFYAIRKGDLEWLKSFRKEDEA